MKKSLLLTILELTYFSVLFTIIPSLVIRNRFSNYNLTSTKIIPIKPNQPINFSFLPLHNHLNSLSFQLKNPNILNHDPYQLDIFNHQGALLKSITFYGSNVGDPSRLDLKFTPLDLDQKYPISVEISTQSHNTNQLFIETDNNNTPVFFSTFKPDGVISSLLFVFDQQKIHLQSFSRNYFIIYMSLVILINFFLINNFLKRRD